MSEQYGNYEILRKLASGGMAEVFLAKQTSLGGFERLVCIKRILPHLCEQGDFITMFQDEARIAANFIHPNIAQIYDIGKVEESYFIAMEYVRGEDLRRIYNGEVARGRAMPLEPAAQIAMGAAAGLDYAHRQTTIDGRPLGIVHRDVSPQNILVTYDGHVKLVDFGVAKAAVKMNETRSGVLKGKYSYMSPEQASGDPIDARTDIFALGITLYEVTTGTRLFKRENELETLHAVIECDVSPPGHVIPGYDPDLEAIILKALAYDPDDRYPTAGELERDLERFLISRSHPTSASSLGTYMQDLFAEKLADELLFGGQPWDEDHTPTRKGTRKHSRSESQDHERRREGQSAPQSIDPNEVTEVDEHSKDKEARSAWSSSKAGESSDGWGEVQTAGWGSVSASEQTAGWSQVGPPKKHQGWGSGTGSGSRTGSNTETVVSGSRPRPEKREPTRSRRGLPPVRERRPNRWLPALAFAVFVIGIGVGLALILTSQRSGAKLDRSGPLTIDTEPRGARVLFIGLGSEPLNQRYDGYRTPFTIKEGVPIDLRLRVRFIKDGYELTEVNIPPLEAGVVPKPLFVELLAAESAPGTLVLLSTPPGAEVYIDGNRIDGKTPIKDIRVTGGEMHRIEFRMEGKKPRFQTLFVEPGAQRIVDETWGADEGDSGESAASPAPEDEEPEEQTEPEPPPPGPIDAPPPRPIATPKPGKAPPRDERPRPTRGGKAYLSITAPLKLKVTLDSRSLGQTPLERVAVEPGVHKLKLENAAEGFVIRRKVRLVAGRTETIDLQPRKGKLAVNATPWAWVRVGRGASPVETPTRLDLYEGEYTVLFECPDGRKKREQARVSPGQTSSVTVSCKN